MTNAMLGVLEHKHQTGAMNLTDSVPPQIIMPLTDIFETPFNTDAHFTCYQPVGNFHDKEWPRLNKPILPRLRALDVDLAMQMIVLDYDNPGHLPWSSREQVDDFINMLQYLSKTNGFVAASEWSCFYTTKHGARLVYILTNPLTPEEFEGKHQWLCQEFNKYGVEIDVTVSDWTRVMRAPYVVRDGEPSWEDPFFKYEAAWDKRLDPETLGTAVRERQSQYAEIIPINQVKPDDTVTLDLLHELSPTSGRQVMSQWLKDAKSRLKGRSCVPIVFGTELIGEHGERDNNLHKVLGQVIGVLFYLDDTTPEHIYALMLEAVNKLEPDDGTPDWSRVLWDHICRLWAKEDAKAREKQHIEEERVEKAGSQIETIVAGMRDWTENSQAFSPDPQEVIKFVERRMIAQHGRSYFPIMPNGRYVGDALLSEQLIPWIRSHEMDSMMETHQYTEDGATKDIDRTTLINKYAFPVKEVTGLPQIEGGYITEDERLVISLYRRNPRLTPQYHAGVEQWLMVLFGEHFERVCKWIGYALAFEDGPVCALSIKGDPGVGKKMFIQGLAECLENPWVAEADDIVSEYQYGLLRSPFLAVNEGWPTQRSRHPADTFRRLVGGDGLLANQKFHAPIRIKNPARVVFAANNMDVVSFLTGGRDLSPEDREALQIRLFHVDVGGDAAAWLRANGGTRFTGGWIEGDGGKPSDYVVARHFLHLHKTRANYGQPEPRLLVEGKPDSELMFAMRTQSGRGPLVVEAVIRLLNTEGSSSKAGIAIEDGKLYVLASEILTYYRQQMASSTRGESLTAKIIGNVLKGLVEYDHNKPLQLKTKPQMGRKRWHQLDPEMLHHAAQRDGWRCDKLVKLVNERVERKQGHLIERPVTA